MHMACLSYHLSTIPYLSYVRESHCLIMRQRISRIRYSRWAVRHRQDRSSQSLSVLAYWYGWINTRKNIWKERSDRRENIWRSEKYKTTHYNNSHKKQHCKTQAIRPYPHIQNKRLLLQLHAVRAFFSLTLDFRTAMDLHVTKRSGKRQRYRPFSWQQETKKRICWQHLTQEQTIMW